MTIKDVLTLWARWAGDTGSCRRRSLFCNANFSKYSRAEWVKEVAPIQKALCLENVKKTWLFFSTFYTFLELECK